MMASTNTPEPRELLLTALLDYEASHPDESYTCARFIEFVRSHIGALQRSCPHGHVTGSAFVVDPALQRTLLVHHHKLDKWLQPGGHCEPGETVAQAAVRETLEETGVDAVPYSDGIFDIDIHPIPARGSEPEHFHYDVRYLIVTEPGLTIVSEESRAVEWLGLSEALRRNSEPSIARMVAKTRAIGVRN